MTTASRPRGGAGGHPALARAALVLRGLAIVLLPVALILSHRNLALLLCVLGLASLAALPRYRPPAWAVPFLLLAGYAALSVLWSPAHEDADWAARIPAFLLLLLAALTAARTAREGEARLYGSAVLAGCLLLGVEALSGGIIRDLVPPYQRPDKDDVATARGVGLAILLLPGAVLCLHRVRGGRVSAIAAGLAFLCLGAGALRFGVTANALALLAAIAAAGLALTAPRATGLRLAGTLAAGFVLMPLLAHALPPGESLATIEAGPVSWRQRMVIWKTVADFSAASPWPLLFGAGQHAADALGQGAGTVILPGYAEPLPRLPSHPHNIFLQVFLEFGLLGTALAASGAVLATRRLARTRPAPDAAAAAAALGAAALVLMMVDAGLWSLWRASALALGAYGLALGLGARQAVVPEGARGYRAFTEKRSPPGG
jgi:O-antigen ligase